MKDTRRLLISFADKKIIIYSFLAIFPPFLTEISKRTIDGKDEEVSFRFSEV